MINLEKWMAKVSEKLNVTTADYTVTTGTEQFFGVYYANITLTKPNPSMFYVYNVESNRPTYVQRVSSNMMRVNSTAPGSVVTVRCLYIPGVGGVISYLLHLTGSLKSFVGRRWASYVKPHEDADEAVRAGELSCSHSGSAFCYHGSRQYYGMDYGSYAINGNCNWNSRVFCRRDKQYEYERLLFANATNGGSACDKEYNVNRRSNYSADYVSRSRLTTIPGEGVMAC